MQDFTQLKVWAKSHQLTLDLYGATKSFPKDEVFGLRSQIRRACSSIPANIAEGCGRGTKAELAQFLRISAGSASELQYHILLARDLDLIDHPRHAVLSRRVVEVKRMLSAFITRLRSTDD